MKIKRNGVTFETPYITPTLHRDGTVTYTSIPRNRLVKKSCDISKADYAALQATGHGEDAINISLHLTKHGNSF